LLLVGRVEQLNRPLTVYHLGAVGGVLVAGDVVAAVVVVAGVDGQLRLEPLGLAADSS